MIVPIKQIVLAEPLTEGIVDSIKTFLPKLPKKKEFKIESTPADTRKLQAVRNEIKKTKHQLEVVKMHQKVMNRVQLAPEELNPKPKAEFKSTQIRNQDPKNPYHKYLKNVYA